MKLFQRLLIGITIFSSSLFYGTEITPIKQTPLFIKLVDDIKLYKFTRDERRFFHAGDLYEHSIWVYFAFLNLIKGTSIYMQNLQLSDHEKEVAALAAFLHDIGKAGRQNLFNKAHKRSYFLEKDASDNVTKITFKPDSQEHPLIGFEYIAASWIQENNATAIATPFITPRIYQLSDGTYFNFNDLCNEMGLSHNEQKTIALLAGMHYEFGVFRSGKCSCKDFFQKLITLANAINYGPIDEKLLKLTILIQIADVIGLTPVETHITPLFPTEQYTAPTHTHEMDVKYPFREFGYADETSEYAPLKRMDELMCYFKKVYQEQ